MKGKFFGKADMGNLRDYYFSITGDCPFLTQEEERVLINGIDSYTRPLRAFENVFNRKRPALTIEDKKHLIEEAPIEGLENFLEKKYAGKDFWRAEIEQLKENLSAMKKNYREALPMINKLIRPNLRLVVDIALRYARRGVELDDLVEYGNMGLWRAAEKFDSEHSERFCTYASWAIRSAVIKGLMRDEAYCEQQRLVSLSDMNLSGKLKAKPEVIREPYEAELNILVDSVLTDERERILIKMRFGLGSYEAMTLQEVGNVFSVTKERVRQIEKRALGRLLEDERVNKIYKRYVESLD